MPSNECCRLAYRGNKDLVDYIDLGTPIPYTLSFEEQLRLISDASWLPYSRAWLFQRHRRYSFDAHVTEPPPRHELELFDSRCDGQTNHMQQTTFAPNCCNGLLQRIAAIHHTRIITEHTRDSAKSQK